MMEHKPLLYRIEGLMEDHPTLALLIIVHTFLFMNWLWIILVLTIF
jgi:hypothetical protein